MLHFGKMLSGCFSLVVLGENVVCASLRVFVLFGE